MTSPNLRDIVEGVFSSSKLMNKARLVWLKLGDKVTGKLGKLYQQVDTKTPALTFYTTGTTGEPKPVVLCHENSIVPKLSVSNF